jgi:putative redox protein
MIGAMRDAAVKTGTGKFGQTITIGPHSLVADEAVAAGGNDAGPEPHEILLAALGACTSMTVKLYADRKGWPLERCEVAVSIARETGKATFHRSISLVGPLDDDQRKRLLDIASKCPVHKTLTGTIAIDTALI